MARSVVRNAETARRAERVRRYRYMCRYKCYWLWQKFAEESHCFLYHIQNNIFNKFAHPYPYALSAR